MLTPPGPAVLDAEAELVPWATALALLPCGPVDPDWDWKPPGVGVAKL